MSRSIRVSFALVAALALIASGAWANIPDPVLSSVPGAITLSPGTQYAGNPIGTFTVNVQGALGPVNGAFVEVEVAPDADALVAWCVGQTHPLQATAANASGDATFTFLGGGCLDPNATFVFNTYIAQVRADGINLGEPVITSPDAVNSNGRTATQISGPQQGLNNLCQTDAAVLPPPGNPNGRTTTVGLADAVFHTRPIQIGLVELCTNYTPPYFDNVAVLDAVFVTPYIQNANICGCQ